MPGHSRILQAMLIPALAVAACATKPAPAPIAAPAPIVEAPPPAPPPLEPAPDPKLVARVQAALDELGYDPGPVDGVGGARTQTAIQAFRKAAKLPEQGPVDEALLAVLQKAQRARLVRTVQTRLIKLGYLDAAPDGVTGPKTRTAIEAYQRDANLSGDPKATRALLKSLNETIAQREGTAPPVDPGAEIANGTDPGEAVAAAPQAPVSKQGLDAPSVPAQPAVPPPAAIARAAPPVIDNPLAGADGLNTPNRLRPGDTVRVRLSAEQSAPSEIRIAEDGMLTLPNGIRVRAAGLDPSAVEHEIAVALTEAYLRGLSVSVDPGPGRKAAAPLVSGQSEALPPAR